MTRELLLFEAASAVTLGLVGAAGYRYRAWLLGFLTPAEWKMFFQVLAIVVAALLLFTSIAGDSAGENFIYGNF